MRSSSLSIQENIGKEYFEPLGATENGCCEKQESRAVSALHLELTLLEKAARNLEPFCWLQVASESMNKHVSFSWASS